jgi:pyruvate dehydrogenase E2 component (dihydrolipoamide acetyltransferase)
VSTVVSNVGATIGAAENIGVRFRAAAFSPPSKLIHLGSVFGIGPVERVPVVVGDRVEVGSALPVLFVFDHRLVDGVMGSRILARLGEILADPAAVWGEPG